MQRTADRTGKSELKIKNYETSHTLESLPAAAGQPSLILLIHSCQSLTPSLPTSVAATLRGFAIYPAVAQPAVFTLRASRLCHGLPAGSVLVRSKSLAA